MTTGTKRIFAHDPVVQPNATPTYAEPKGFTVGDRLRELDAEAAKDPASASYDPNTDNQLGVDEYEASARALEDANQPASAIQSWHRAAIAHSVVGNHAGVKAAIVHAERLAGNADFAPSLTKKGTASDAEPENGGEIFGDDPAQSNTASADETLGGEESAVTQPVPANGEVFGGTNE
jgi:hypothetical protein